MSTREEIIEKASKVKVFISYAWDTNSKDRWVVDLATDLMNNGIDVILDRFELKAGADVHKFMESCISDNSITHVIIICDEKYSTKANDRSGGTGVESSVISPALHRGISNKKFIPLVREYDDNGAPYLPTYLSPRIYIDFSDHGKYMDKFIDLKREILDEPELKKPKLGEVNLEGLIENTSSKFTTRKYYYSIKKASRDSPHLVNGILNDLLDTATTEVDTVLSTDVVKTYEEAGKIVHKQIVDLTQLRDDIIESIYDIVKNSADLNYEIIEDFLTSLRHKNYTNSREYQDWWDDFHLFFTTEIFIYISAIALKLKDYDLLDAMVNTTYFISLNGNLKAPAPYTVFSPKKSSALSAHHGVNKDYTYSAFSTTVMTRVHKFFTENELIETDITLSALSKFTEFLWPQSLKRTDGKYFNQCRLLSRLESYAHFTRVMNVFRVEFTEGLIQRIRSLDTKENSFYEYNLGVEVKNYINVENIGSKK